MPDSPFHKNAVERTCPSCRSKVPASLARCSCGAVLDVDGSSSGEGLVTQAEVLYESYLNARMQRAIKTLQSTRLALVRDPTHAKLIEQMREVMREIETLRAQIVAQSSRTEEARRKDAEDKKEPAVHGPAQQSVPDDAFRAAQVLRAEQAFRAASEAKRSETPHVPAADSAFNAAQAAIAQRIAAADLCPVCRAEMGPDGRCRACGYARRPAATDQDFLTKEEIAALKRPLTRG
jgi:hypothetical protein